MLYPKEEMAWEEIELDFGRSDREAYPFGLEPMNCLNKF